jgi:hypothetical protein
MMLLFDECGNELAQISSHNFVGHEQKTNPELELTSRFRV